ncbi:MAG: class I SAM-dependent methyltransferase [Verrucomicrobiia bacterium]
MNNFVEGNYEDKYNAKNPISKLLMNNFLKSFKASLDEIDENEIKTVCEVGVGEGSLLKNLVKIFPKAKYWATDLSDSEVKKAKNSLEGIKKVNFNVQNAENLYVFKDKQFDLIICCEVLEHVMNYKKALTELKRISKKYVLISVPNEPIWRILNMIRGKYLSEFGNTPGHLNHWSSITFKKLIKSEKFLILDIKHPFPWQMVLLKVS